MNPEDEKITQHSVPDWQNPELLAELKVVYWQSLTES